MRVTQEQYNAILARQLAGQRNRKRALDEKQQDADPRPSHHGPQEAKVDGSGGGKFRVSITLLVSDARDRDPDGMATTILDSYLMALGRLSGLDRTAFRKLAKSQQG
ncbi:MAG: hypothetical protein RL595_1163 [Planctomycetota bacterium]